MLLAQGLALFIGMPLLVCRLILGCMLSEGIRKTNANANRMRMQIVENIALELNISVNALEYALAYRVIEFGERIELLEVKPLAS